MQKIIIQLELTDDEAKAFVGREVMLSIPAMKADYLAFLDHANRLHDGLEMFGAVLKKMRTFSAAAELVEGIASLSELGAVMAESERVLQTFFAPSAVTEIAIARTGEKLQ